jgi:hypothetical protein
LKKATEKKLNNRINSFFYSGWEQNLKQIDEDSFNIIGVSFFGNYSTKSMKKIWRIYFSPFPKIFSLNMVDVWKFKIGWACNIGPSFFCFPQKNLKNVQVQILNLIHLLFFSSWWSIMSKHEYFYSKVKYIK